MKFYILHLTCNTHVLDCKYLQTCKFGGILTLSRRISIILMEFHEIQLLQNYQK